MYGGYVAEKLVGCGLTDGPRLENNRGRAGLESLDASKVFLHDVRKARGIHDLYEGQPNITPWGDDRGRCPSEGESEERDEGRGKHHGWRRMNSE